MVKKHILEKLSDNELLLYIQPESRKVSDAIKYAKEILVERGHSFSESESKRIDDLISTKLVAETDFPEAPPVIGIERWLPKEKAINSKGKIDHYLYSKRIIALISLIFGFFLDLFYRSLIFLKLAK